MIAITLLYVVGLFTALVLIDYGVLGLGVIDTYINNLPVFDKFVHFSMFGLMALLANVALTGRPKWKFASAVAAGSLTVMALSTLEEISNNFVPYRSWAISDLMANYLGIFCLGILPVVTWHALRRSAAVTDSQLAVDTLAAEAPTFQEEPATRRQPAVVLASAATNDYPLDRVLTGSPVGAGVS